MKNYSPMESVQWKLILTCKLKISYLNPTGIIVYVVLKKTYSADQLTLDGLQKLGWDNIYEVNSD